MEEKGDQLPDPAKESIGLDELTERVFLYLTYSMVVLMIVIACLLPLCICFRGCTDAMDLEQQPVEALVGRSQQGSRYGATDSCQQRNVNQAFVPTEHQAQGNPVEQPEVVGEITQGQFTNKDVKNTNRPSMLSFGDNNSRDFPSNAITYLGPQLPTIVESKTSDKPSLNDSKSPFEEPKTPPSTTILQAVPTTSSGLQNNFLAALSSTHNSFNLPHAETQYPILIRLEVYRTSDQNKPREVLVVPLNSQERETSDSGPPPFRITEITPIHQGYQTYDTFPTTSQSNESPELPRRIQNDIPLVFQKSPRKEQINHFSTADASQIMNNSSQRIKEPEKPYSSSGTAVGNFQTSASSSSISVSGGQSLFVLGTSRLQHYRGANISPDDINSTNLINRHIYCLHCNCQKIACECPLSNKNGNPDNSEDE